MSTADSDWSEWESAWRTHSATDAVHVAALVKGQRRRARRTRLVEALAAAAVLATIGGALLHAPDPADLLRGGLVAAVVVAAAALRLAGGRRGAALAEPTRVFVHAAARECRRELAAIRFVWVLMGLALAFLIPWWIDGYGIHGSLLDAQALVSAWLPAAVIAGAFAWTLRLRATLRSELDALSRAAPSAGA